MNKITSITINTAIQILCLSSVWWWRERWLRVYNTLTRHAQLIKVFLPAAHFVVDSVNEAA